MRERTTGWVRALARAVVLPTALFVLGAGYVVVGAQHAAEAASDRTGATTADPARVWHASYSRRYPGCVALVLWPRGELPTALVVRDRTGAIARVSVREAAVRLRSAEHTDVIVGACR